jgi:hypothetical protein
MRSVTLFDKIMLRICDTSRRHGAATCKQNPDVHNCVMLHEQDLAFCQVGPLLQRYIALKHDEGCGGYSFIQRSAFL